MKTKLFYLIGILLITNYTFGQSVIDTVSTGAGYAKQVWYSLENDEQGDAPKNNWDIAFDCGGFGSSIHINSVIGTKLWKYPASDTVGWSTVDTTGITGWVELFNSDTTWKVGAFNASADTSNGFDLGWGLYNNLTHIVTGDSLFIIKLANNQYKKIWIKKLQSGVYTFRYAGIDNTNDTTVNFAKGSFTGKNFGYYSIQNKGELNREPLSSNWDLLFTQYLGFIPSPYAVTGVLSNKDVTIAKAENLSSKFTYTHYNAHPFNTAINTIGYNWKAFNNQTFQWTIQDSLAYFVKTAAGDIWRIVFTGFGGMSTGNYIFTKEKIAGVSVEESTNRTHHVKLFPNPANSHVNILIDGFKANNIDIIDINGRLVNSFNPTSLTDFAVFNIDVSNLSNGLYFIRIVNTENSITEKLLIK